MNDHVAKPLDPEDLWHKLRRWVQPRSAHRPLAAPPAVAASGQPLPDIPGLDTALGLRHAMGREGLYLSLLGRFLAGQSGFTAAMQAALQTADWPAAELLAHTLKGVSAQIGASTLRQSAAQLEAALQQQPTPQTLEPHLAQTTGLLAPLLHALEQQLPARPEALPTAGPVDGAALQALCTRLYQLLGCDDFASSSTIREHEPLLRAAMDEQFEPFAAAVEDYDFHGALQQLMAFAARAGLAL